MTAITKQELVSYLKQYYMYLFYDESGNLYAHPRINNELVNLSYKYLKAYKMLRKNYVNFWEFPCNAFFEMHTKLLRYRTHCTMVLVQTLPPKIVINMGDI